VAVTTSRVRVGGHVGLGVGEATHDLRPITNLAWHWPANRNLLGVTPRRDLMRDSLLALCAAKTTPVSSTKSLASAKATLITRTLIHCSLLVLIKQSEMYTKYIALNNCNTNIIVHIYSVISIVFNDHYLLIIF